MKLHQSNHVATVTCTFKYVLYVTHHCSFPINIQTTPRCFVLFYPQFFLFLCILENVFLLSRECILTPCVAFIDF